MRDLRRLKKQNFTKDFQNVPLFDILNTES